MRQFIFALCVCFSATALTAGEIAPRDGWVIIQTGKSHKTLLADLKTAVKTNGMGVVTQAGPTATAKKRGIVIPENRVVGVFNNKFAVDILAQSTAAMIEAPIRFYITERKDGAATLSYKTPSFVFAPYEDEGGARLTELAAELDLIFNTIAQAATQ